MAPLLEIQRLTKRFGGLTAVSNVTLAVAQHEIVGLIGPNGAGKTTLFNCITALLRPEQGSILFGQHTKEQLIGMAPHGVVQCGVARTFQNIRLFAQMSVVDHVIVGAYARTHAGMVATMLRTPEAQHEHRWTFDHAMQLLELVGLEASAEEPATKLPFGWQRRLEIARALASKPELLLLDEPAAGLNPTEKQELLGLIQRVRAQGVTILLIEHDMRFVMPVSDRVAVLDYGELIAEGTPQAIQNDPRVIEAYLGKPTAC